MTQTTRRSLLTAGIGGLGLGLWSSRAQAQTEDDPARWLGGTRFINTDHRDIQSVSETLRSNSNHALDYAQNVFAFVRDEIKFGFTSGFWHNTASEVLNSRLGYCNTKSTLFMALLRSGGIPARQVFVDIHKDVLRGLIDPGTPYVDHSYVEVFLNDQWVATDAYIVDQALFEPAQTRLIEEGRILGYGVHQTGSNTWSGSSPSFSQFNILDDRTIGTRHWGVFADVEDFYARAEAPWNRLNPILRSGFGVFASQANRRADAIRGS